MIYEGALTKMQTELGDPIQYYLVCESSFLHVNQLLGKDIQIEFTGYECINCVKKKKVFRQGFCYDCFTSSAAVGDWIMRPELSTAHLGIADRDLDYESKVQLQPHVVYLALSSEIKVGVTRLTQLPVRWIDQGAEKALTALELPNRYLAGITEVALKSRYADKTNWRKMLTNEICSDDLFEAKETLIDLLPEEVQQYYNPKHSEIVELKYPILEYPPKVKSLSLDKTASYRGTLVGIKGQYLIFRDGTVFNVRTYEGFCVRISM